MSLGLDWAEYSKYVLDIFQFDKAIALNAEQREFLNRLFDDEAFRTAIILKAVNSSIFVKLAELDDAGVMAAYDATPLERCSGDRDAGTPIRAYYDNLHAVMRVVDIRLEQVIKAANKPAPTPEEAWAQMVTEAAE